MTETKPEWSKVDENHNMTKMMSSLIAGHTQICDEAGITPWDFCVILANVQGIILGMSKSIPTDEALERIQELGKVASLRLLEERSPSTSKRRS